MDFNAITIFLSCFNHSINTTKYYESLLNCRTLFYLKKNNGNSHRIIAEEIEEEINLRLTLPLQAIRMDTPLF